MSLRAKRIWLGIGLVLALGGIYWLLAETGITTMLTDQASLRREIEKVGAWGPVVVISLMLVAVVLSPIPSGPIALVAGAVYGPLLGALYVVIGAELGAVIAFSIARYFGYGFVRKRLSGRLSWLTQRQSQNSLMAAVFVSRMIPFISFDAVSYAAGLTSISAWRFAAATLAGVIPVAYLITYFGKQLIELKHGPTVLIAIAVGAVTLVPIVATWLSRAKRPRNE